jgi:hypothetical protein
VAVISSETKRDSTVLMLCALIPGTVWVAAMIIIGNTIGYHSTAGIWAVLFGFPGDILGDWIGHWTNSELSSYVASFVGIWLFWFGLFKVALAIKHRVSGSR